MARVNENIAKGIRNSEKIREVKNALRAFINADKKLKKAAEGNNGNNNNNASVNSFINNTSVVAVGNNVSSSPQNYNAVTNAAERFYALFKNFENGGLRMGDLDLSVEEQEALRNARRLAGSIQRENVNGSVKRNINNAFRYRRGTPGWYEKHGGKSRRQRKSRKASRRRLTRRRR